MFQILTDHSNRDNDNIEDFGIRYDSYVSNETNKTRIPQYTNVTPDTYSGISVGDTKTVLFQPLMGIFNQEKYLPIRYAPITIEMELVNTFDEVVVWPPNAAPGALGQWAQTVCSKDWKIIQVQVKCDVCTLDNALDNEYAQHLMSGQSLPINYNTFVTQNQVLGSKKSAVNVTRSVSRLNRSL
jgi:hypothetical protein